jgi:hypothetical protein
MTHILHSIDWVLVSGVVTDVAADLHSVEVVVLGIVHAEVGGGASQVFE